MFKVLMRHPYSDLDEVDLETLDRLLCGWGSFVEAIEFLENAPVSPTVHATAPKGEGAIQVAESP